MKIGDFTTTTELNLADLTRHGAQDDLASPVSASASPIAEAHDESSDKSSPTGSTDSFKLVTHAVGPQHLGSVETLASTSTPTSENELMPLVAKQKYGAKDRISKKRRGKHHEASLGSQVSKNQQSYTPTVSDSEEVSQSRVSSTPSSLPRYTSAQTGEALVKNRDLRPKSESFKIPGAWLEEDSESEDEFDTFVDALEVQVDTPAANPPNVITRKLEINLPSGLSIQFPRTSRASFVAYGPDYVEPTPTTPALAMSTPGLRRSDAADEAVPVAELSRAKKFIIRNWHAVVGFAIRVLSMLGLMRRPETKLPPPDSDAEQRLLQDPKRAVQGDNAWSRVHITSDPPFEVFQPQIPSEYKTLKRKAKASGVALPPFEPSMQSGNAVPSWLGSAKISSLELDAHGRVTGEGSLKAFNLFSVPLSNALRVYQAVVGEQRVRMDFDSFLRKGAFLADNELKELDDLKN